MKELKNEPKGIISEEALDQVAAGMDVDRAKLKKFVTTLGIVVVGGAALTGAGIGGKALIDRRRSTHQSTSQEYYDGFFGRGDNGTGEPDGRNESDDDSDDSDVSEF